MKPKHVGCGEAGIHQVGYVEYEVWDTREGMPVIRCFDTWAARQSWYHAQLEDLNTSSLKRRHMYLSMCAGPVDDVRFEASGIKVIRQGKKPEFHSCASMVFIHEENRKAKAKAEYDACDHP